MRTTVDYRYNTSLSSKSVAAVLGGCLAITGSGFNAPGGNELQRQYLLSSPSIIVKNEQVSGIDVEKNVFLKQLEYIKSTFELRDEELADVLGVARKTLSNWRNQGSLNRDKDRERFFEVYSLAEVWNRQGFPSSRNLVLLPIVNDISVLKLLRLEVLDTNKILFFGRSLVRKIS